MDCVSWQIPVPPLLASTLNDAIWGYVFVRRGFETALLRHALSEGILLRIFTAGSFPVLPTAWPPVSPTAMRSAAPAMPMSGGSHVEIRGL